MDRNQIAGIVAVVGAVVFAFLYARGTPPDREQYLRALPLAVTVLSVFYIAFNGFLWRLPGVRHLLARGQPYVGGTWDVEMRSNWVDPKTGEKIPPIRAYMAIRQRFDSLSLRIMTKESASETLSANLVRKSDGVWSIATVYQNNPKVAVRGRSPIHLGAMSLQVHEDSAMSLAGHYWTDRSTSGDIELTNRRRKVFYSYENAKAE